MANGVVVTGSFAAVRKAPIAGPALLVMYIVPSGGAPRFETTATELGLRPTDEAPDVVLLLPSNDRVVIDPWEDDGVRFVNLPQLAVDCLGGTGRMPAEGDALHRVDAGEHRRVAVPVVGPVPSAAVVTLDPYYVAARRVLLDTLDDLAAHRDAIVVVGAQAVYLRTGAANVGVAEYTTDGDLAVASDLLADSPLLEDLMSTRFEHARRGPTAAEEPGVWTRSVEIDGESIEIPVDLMVPEGIAPSGGTREHARSPRQASRSQGTGLEAAIIDNDFLTIEALDDHSRSITAKVAGPTALLIAKAHKINDRLAQEARPDRLIDKDASDVYRLMLTMAPERITEVMPSLLDDQRVAEPAQRGLELLRAQFGARRAPGVEMAVHALRLGVPEDRVRTVCVAFVAALS